MKKIIILSSLTFLWTFLQGQDLVFSQYMGSSIYTNASLTGTGSDKGGSNSGRISTLYRTQWAMGTSNKFNSNYISYDQKITNGFGNVGFYVISDRAGAGGALSTTQANMTYSYQTPFGRKGWVGRYGLSVGIRSQGVDISKLRFEDQIDYTKRDLGNTQEVLSSNRVAKADVNAGFMIHNENFYFGGAIHNITRPNFDYLGALDNFIERRISIQIGGNVVLNDGSYGVPLKLLPQMTYLKQKDFSQLNAGLGLKYDNFYVGTGYRKSMLNFKNADAMIFSIGIIKDHMRVSYSYEKVLSSIRFYAPVTHEFGIQFALTSKRRILGDGSRNESDFNSTNGGDGKGEGDANLNSSGENGDGESDGGLDLDSSAYRKEVTVTNLEVLVAFGAGKDTAGIRLPPIEKVKPSPGFYLVAGLHNAESKANKQIKDLYKKGVFTYKIYDPSNKSYYVFLKEFSSEKEANEGIFYFESAVPQIWIREVK